MNVATQPSIDRITVQRGQRSGQPCIRSLRITAWDVLEMLADGMSEDDILADFPYLEKADFQAVYAYAALIGSNRKSN